LEHDKNILSHVMCGFNYFDTHGHEAKGQSLHSIQIFGSSGNMRLIGYDWETSGVVLDNSPTEQPALLATESNGYEWQEGARVTGESIVTGIKPKINVEHALHVLEIIEAARKSAATGMRVKLESKFPWPMM
jgi:predicted dehydrogenase